MLFYYLIGSVIMGLMTAVFLTFNENKFNLTKFEDSIAVVVVFTVWFAIGFLFWVPLMIASAVAMLINAMARASQ